MLHYTEIRAASSCAILLPAPPVRRPPLRMGLLRWANAFSALNDGAAIRKRKARQREPAGLPRGPTFAAGARFLLFLDHPRRSPPPHLPRTGEACRLVGRANTSAGLV